MGKTARFTSGLFIRRQRVTAAAVRIAPGRRRSTSAKHGDEDVCALAAAAFDVRRGQTGVSRTSDKECHTQSVRSLLLVMCARSLGDQSIVDKPS